MMNKIKAIISLILPIIMIVVTVGFVDITSFADETIEADWQNNAIISPKEGKLVGAGYIDIKWNNNLDNVSTYQIYVDGVSKAVLKSTSEEIMTYEMYTTSVNKHSVHIVATLTNGTIVTTQTRIFYVTKKGICANAAAMAVAVNPSDMNIGWYYNWGTTSFKNSNYINKNFYELEFVPMIWGEPRESYESVFEKARTHGHKYILAYNEPDLVVEANISSSTAILRWNNYFLKNKGNLRLGSPAVHTFPSRTDWWKEFYGGLSQEGKNSISFIAVHNYQHTYSGKTDALQYLNAIDEVYEKYKKPIWVTEFAVADNYNPFNPNNPKHLAYVEEFMKIVVKGLNERAYVERYAWFSFDVVDKIKGASATYNLTTGELTNLGKIYANLGNPKGYVAKTYNVKSDTTINTTQKACAAVIETKVYGIEAKKKSFKYTFKSVINATGYQIQYSLNKKFKKAKKYKTKIKVIKQSSRVTITGKIKRLKKKTRYYVRIRAYKIFGGKKLYCKWSKRYKVRTKK